MTAGPGMTAPTTTSRIGPTLGGLIGKNLRQFVRSPHQAMLVMVQQVMFLLIFRYVLGGAIEVSESLRYVDYLAPGVVVAGAVFAATRAAVTTVEDRLLGFNDRVRSLPIPNGTSTLARCASDGLVTLGAVAVTVLAAVVVGFRPAATLSELLTALALLVLFALSSTAIFVVLGQIADDVETAQGLGFVAIPVTFVSSAYVPTDGMPRWLAMFADHQPVTVVIDNLRALVTDAPADNASPWFVLVWTLGLVATASAIGWSRR